MTSCSTEEVHGLPLKRWSTSTRLHGVTSQKIVHFIVTAVRTSNPTTIKFVVFVVLTVFVSEELCLLGYNTV
jgi:hypothetical protein